MSPLAQREASRPHPPAAPLAPESPQQPAEAVFAEHVAPSTGADRYYMTSTVGSYSCTSTFIYGLRSSVYPVPPLSRVSSSEPNLSVYLGL